MGSIFDDRFAQVRDGAPLEESESAPVEEFTPEVQRDIVSLLRLGRIEDSFELYGHSFVIRTLNIEEEIAIDALLASKFSSTLNEKAMITATVAATLTLVDGEPLVRSLGLGETSELSRAYDRVKKWYRPVIEKLYEHYNVLSNRQSEALAELEKKDETGLSTSEASSDSPTNKAS